MNHFSITPNFQLITITLILTIILIPNTIIIPIPIILFKSKNFTPFNSIPPNQTKAKARLLKLFYNTEFSLFFLFPRVLALKYQLYLYLVCF